MIVLQANSAPGDEQRLAFQPAAKYAPIMDSVFQALTHRLAAHIHSHGQTSRAIWYYNITRLDNSIAHPHCSALDVFTDCTLRAVSA